jgi:two-component system, OmpR family, sensor kinase
VSPACCTRSGEPDTSSAPDQQGGRGNTGPGSGADRSGWPQGTPGSSQDAPRRLFRGIQRAPSRIYAQFDRMPIRVRLAVASALLTFTILCAFALVVGSVTVHRIRSDFDREAAISATNLAALLEVQVTGSDTDGFGLRVVRPFDLNRFASSEHAVIRILRASGTVLAETTNARKLKLSSTSPALVFPNDVNIGGYRVYSREVTLPPPVGGAIIVQYGRPLSEVNASVARVELFLVLGVFGGVALALLAGIALARRAMAPIAELTRTADEIAHTRDASRTMPEQHADDEVAELARTLGGMLHSLDVAHAETEAMLERQRRFVADASHELRTPLTSVLANLELLVDSLRGEEADAARSALRSSQRMRRLVGDLLLLARTDVGRVVSREPCDLAQIVIEAAAELGPVSARHEISLDAQPAMVQASRDELHRLAINLVENALRHTPPGTEIRARTEERGGRSLLIVEDDGPGVPEPLAESLFERFVRGAGDRGGSFGLGLAIVKAVAESHGGSVTVSRAHPGVENVGVEHPAVGPGAEHPVVGRPGAEHPGARFTVSLPAAPSDLDDHGKHHRPAPEAVIDQLR